MTRPNLEPKSQSTSTGPSQGIVERTYRATVQELWDLWTTIDGFESWWGPENFHVKVHRLEARHGGALHYDMIAGTPEMVEALKQMDRPASHEARATFSQFLPLKRLTLTHIIDFLPGVPSYESMIEVEFLALGDRARMVVHFGPMHNEIFTQMSQEGFGSQLCKLDRRYNTAEA